MLGNLPQMLKTLALALTRSSTRPAGVRLMDPFDWLVLGLTLTCAALMVGLYW